MKRIQNKNGIILLVALLTICGCAVGPKFESPEVEVPDVYNYSLTDASVDTLVNLEWWENFGDTTLTQLIGQAIDNNRDLAVAMSRIQQSRLQLKMVRADFGPSFGIGLQGGASYTHRTKIVQQYSIEPTIAWEIDLFGKIRRTAEAAHAQMLSTEQNYRSVMLSLVAEVATSYFSLLQYDMLLDISRDTYLTRRKSLDLVDSLLYYGASSAIDLERVRSLTATAAAAIPQYERAMVQTEMALCALLGQNPKSIKVDGMRLLSATMVPKVVPTGLPTSLLDRRPDILQAYYQVAAATANVGVAVANRYPSLTLTGQGGLLSSTLKGLFTGNPFGWSGAVSITEPLFAFGRKKRAVEIAREENKQAVWNYEQSVIEALGEVESALAGVATYREQVENYQELLSATQMTQMLTKELYNAGNSDYLDVLDAERELFSAQIGFAGVLSAQLGEYVELYKVLGGGWGTSCLRN